MTGNDEEVEAFLADSAEEPATPLAGDGELVDLLGEIAELRAEKEELDTRLKTVNKMIAEKNAVVLATFDARGIPKMAVTTDVGVRVFGIRTSPHPRVVDRKRWLDWIDNVLKQPELAPRTTPYMTLRAFWKERMENGLVLPSPDIAEAFMDRKIFVLKGK